MNYKLLLSQTCLVSSIYANVKCVQSCVPSTAALKDDVKVNDASASLVGRARHVISDCVTPDVLVVTVTMAPVCVRLAGMDVTAH